MKRRNPSHVRYQGALRLPCIALPIAPLLCLLVPGALASCSPQEQTETTGTESGWMKGVLVGDRNLESGHDANAPGSAEAFRYVARASGTLGALAVYIDSSNAATVVNVGLYADSAGEPGALLTSGTIANPQAGAWSTVPVPNVGVVASTPYWIAVLSPAGNGDVHFRDVASGGGPTQKSAQTTLGSLPSTWSPGPSSGNSPMSAYGIVALTSTADSGATASTADSGATDASPVDSGVTDASTCSTSTSNTTIFGDMVPSNASDSDTNPIELGVKFQTTAPATITGVRFYKGVGNTGTHVGKLYAANGTLLAASTFLNETASGWQTVLFDQPVTVSANTTYVASYYAPAGHYAGDNQGLASQIDDPTGTVHAMADGADGGNGVYHYGTGGGFPSSTYLATNYYVDVLAAVVVASVGCNDAAVADAGATADAATDDSGMDSGASAGDASIDAGGGFACDQTLNAGASVANAVSAAPAGSTICLNAGSYPAFNASITKTSLTTVTLAPGLTRGQVTIASVNVGASQNLAFVGMTIGESIVSVPGGAAALHIHFQNNAFTGPLCVYTPTDINQDTLIDGNTFADVGQGCTEGRLGVHGNGVTHNAVNGVVISNNVFSGPGPSDGIQVIGGAYGTVIGPGNEFVGIKESGCGTIHCDPIQFYGATHSVITGNYFHGNSTGLMGNGGDGPVTITNNVFYTDGEYPDQIIRAGTSGDVMTHNTLANGASIRFGDSLGTCTNELIRDNIITGGFSLQYGQTQSTLTIDHNLIPGSAIGAGGISGSPTYAGGAIPTTWGGYRLTSSSLGYKSASDGNDMGANFFGP